jgi:hypothetical protein
MTMNRIVIALAGLLLASAAAAQDAPNMIGTWTGKGQGVGAQEGWTSGDITLVITDQRGPAFKGHVTYPEGTSAQGSGDFVGAVALDGRSITTADADGITTGFLIDPNTLEHCYFEAGADAKVLCARVIRQR